MPSEERRRFAVPAATGEFDEIDLAYLDPADEDERRILILAEHPELYDAIEAGLDEIHQHGTTINPTLHIAMHEIVANQLWDDDPPEVWHTAQRLLNAGYERHEVLHMLASVNSDAVYDALHDEKPADLDAMRAALAALPESWERRRIDIGEQRHANRAERRAAARRHRR
jgi:Domain of unknown function (DUF1841)